MQLGTEQTGTAVNHCHHIQLCPQLFPRLLFHQPVEHLQAVAKLVALVVELYRPRPGHQLAVLVNPATAGQHTLIELIGRDAVACGDLLVEIGELRGGEGTQGKQRAEGEEGAAHQHCSRASQPEPAVGLSSLPRPISCGLALYSS